MGQFSLALFFWGIEMKNKTKILLIVVMMVAAAVAMFGISESFKAQSSKRADRNTMENIPANNGSGGNDEAGEESTDDYSNAESDELLATVFFASDYQADGRFDEPAVTLRGILAAARENGKVINKVVMCGDYTNDPVLHDYQLSPDESIEEIRAIFAEECRNAHDESENDAVNEVLFVQGNHDAMTGEITPTGLLDCGDYLIYVLNTEEDFPWKQGKMPGCLEKVKRSSGEMKKCFDELIQRGEKRPVFIAGHVPLQFTARTSSRHTTGDNLYSSLIFDVVNDAAKSLDIFYLFGHNHSKGWDCYLGGSCVYKAPGETILIPDFDENMVNTDVYYEEVLNFTYLNAGYVGYYMNCDPDEYGYGDYSAADETLTGIVFEIYPDRVVITRYDTEGPHVLGAAGEADPFRGGIDAGLIPEDKYSRETESPQTIERK